MTTTDKKRIEAQAGLIQLESEQFVEGKVWQFTTFGKQGFLLEKEAAQIKTDAAGKAVLSNSVFVALINGLASQKFDGVVTVDLDDCTKKLYFKAGELVFAGSNLIDDRLGEVIYRAGQISLDQLTEAAVQVNRTTKFGRVLLDSKVFTSSQLWDALKLQVLSIFQSVLLYDQMHVQIDVGQNLSPTAVTFDEPTHFLIDNCHGFACLFRQFRARLGAGCQLLPVRSTYERLNVQVGTFLGDTVELLNANPQLGEFLAHSKLTELNSLSAIFDLMNHHIVKIDGIDVSLKGLDTGPAMKRLKGLVDAYHVVVDGGRKAFQSENLEFPILDIEQFLDQQYTFRRSPLFVLGDGTIAPEAIIGIYTKAKTSPRQTEILVNHLQGLILFLLQLIGDLLPNGKGWDLKRSFQHLVV